MSNRKAFDYEPGQYICHVYADLLNDESRETIEDAIRLIQNKQQQSTPNDAIKDWKPIMRQDGDDKPDEVGIHITLLRGHRAIYYHQIRHLIDSLESECDTFKPFSLCLDSINIFTNNEQTRQFLCIAERGDDNLNTLKQKLVRQVNQFAIKLTDEDETTDTFAHCSFMSRLNDNKVENESLVESVKNISDMFFQETGEHLMCLVRLTAINVKIGNHIYKLNLKG